MAVFHVHTVHQKRNPLTARFQRRQSEFGKTLQHAFQDDARELDHLQERMGQGARFNETPKKIEPQALRWRAVDRQGTAQLFCLAIERVEVEITERFWKSRGRQDSTRHLQLLYRPPEFFR